MKNSEIIFTLLQFKKLNTLEYKKIKFTNLDEFNKSKSEPLLKICTPVINANLILLYIFLFTVIWLIISYPSTIFLFPLLVGLGFLINELWKLYEPINVIKINLTHKFFIRISRNQLKRLFNRGDKIFFSEIRKFSISESLFLFDDYDIYYISAILKDSTEIVFTQTLNKTRAEKILNFLNLFPNTNLKD